MQLCMKVSAAAIIALSLFVARGIAVAAEHVDRMALGGQCTDNSFIAEGETGNDLRGRRSRFFCDTVALIFYDNPRHMLISFSDKRSHHPRPLGFAGYIEQGDKSILDVERVYLEGGYATPAPEGGTCKLLVEQGAVKAISCDVTVDETGRRTVLSVGFRVTAGQNGR